MSNYDLDFLTQLAEEMGGGGGYTTTGLVKVELGVKVYLKGMSQAETFFPFVYDDQQSIQNAVHKANELILKSGEKRKPQFAVRFEVMKESVLETKQDGTKASDSWKENRTYDVPTIWWNKDTRKTERHPTYEKLIRPTLDDFVPQEDLGKWLYLQLGSELDITNPESKTQFNEKTILDDEGNIVETIRTPRKNYVPVVLRRFNSEEEARAYAVSGESTPSVAQLDEPDGWDDNAFGSWTDVQQYVRNELDTKLPDTNTPLPKVNKVINALVDGFAPTPVQRPVLETAIRAIQELRVGVPF